MSCIRPPSLVPRPPSPPLSEHRGFGICTADNGQGCARGRDFSYAANRQAAEGRTCACFVFRDESGELRDFGNSTYVES
ncbi:MAG: hypothetical protein AB7S26_00180 [Sandaracinaceae bacterium]